MAKKRIKRINFVFTDGNLCIRDQKARKEHKCEICKGTISKGEIYTVIGKQKYGTKIWLNKKICLMHFISDIF